MSDNHIIVYDKFTGEIIDVLQGDQDPEIYFRNYPVDFVEKLGYLSIDEELPNLMNYYIVKNNKLLKMNDNEVAEIRMYKRILTDEERRLETLKPSPEEVRKAEQTIEILTLIQEVM